MFLALSRTSPIHVRVRVGNGSTSPITIATAYHITLHIVIHYIMMMNDSFLLLKYIGDTGLRALSKALNMM